MEGGRIREKRAALSKKLNQLSEVQILIVTALPLAILVGFLGYCMRSQRIDDAYITYRYARNLLSGNGFVFNPGEPILVTTPPLHGLLLAILGAVTDLPTVANILVGHLDMG